MLLFEITISKTGNIDGEKLFLVKLLDLLFVDVPLGGDNVRHPFLQLSHILQHVPSQHFTKFGLLHTIL